MSVLHDIAINGSGSSGGGTFDKVTIRGEGTITENLDCQVFKTYGTSRVQGNLKTTFFSMYGEAKVIGNFNATDMKVLGSLTIEGPATSKNVKVRGSLDIKNTLKGETADVKGALVSGSDTELEKLDLTGSIQVEGMLNAGTIDIHLKFGESNIDEIGGETIYVRRKKPLPFAKTEGELKAMVTEGDDITLENTKADVVRGKRISIGKGCEINRVEYTETLRKTGGASIKEEIKR